MHALLKEHCMHMAEDLATTGVRTRSLNKKMYKPALVTMERILPTSSLSSSLLATWATYPVLTWCHSMHVDDIVLMMEVETMLFQSGTLVECNDHDGNCQVLHLTVNMST